MEDAEAVGKKPYPAGAPSDSEWRGRPVLSGLLRFAILSVPMLASLAASILLTRVLPFPSERYHLVAWFLGITVVATAVFFGFQRLLHRLLPLASLLSLTMIFPDRAPARFAIARRAGRVRDLEASVAEGRSLGGSPGEAAATVLALVTALTSHDRGTRGHSERTRVFSDMIAAELGLSKQEQGKLRWAALLHDIGKLHVPPGLLNKPGHPDADEWEVIKDHPAQGARIIAPLVAWLGPWAQAVDHHHEKFDGTGYPHGLAGRQISLAGRIVAVADAYETMTAPRPYKRSLSVVAARKELVRSSGNHFDPVVVRAFLNISVGRLRRAVGFAAWVGQVPAGLRILEGTARLGGTAGQAATAVVATVGIVAGVVVGPHLPAGRASAAAPNAPSAPMAVAPANGHPPASAVPLHVTGRLSEGSPGPTGRPDATPAPGSATILPAPAPTGSGASQPSSSPAPPAQQMPVPPPTGAPPNRAPLVILPSATSSEEGGQLSGVHGSFTDPDSTAWTASVDYGDGTGVQPLGLRGTTFELNHDYSRSTEGAQVITVSVRDNQGAVGVATAGNSIADARPQPSISGASATVSRKYLATGSFADPGFDPNDGYSATVDYGDASPPDNFIVLRGAPFTLAHHYPPAWGPTVYLIRLTVRDSGGAQGEATATATIP